jgi:peptide/nickel transport system permease protein
MLQYILKRLFAMLLTLLGITFVTFLIIQAAPGDPVAASIGGAGGGPEAAGGEGGKSRREAAIKTKKKLLGMLVEQHALLAWNAEGASAARETPAHAGVAAPAIESQGALGAFGKWAYSVTIAPSGEFAVVGSLDKRIHVVDLASSEVRYSSEEHPGEVWAVAVSPDGKVFASGDTEGEVFFHASADGRVLGKSPPTKKTIRTVAFAREGTQLLAGYDDGTIRLLATPSGETVAEFKDHNSFVGAIAVAPGGTRFYSAGADRKIREWDLASAKPVRVIGSASATVTTMDITRDGARLAAGTADRRIAVFETAATARAPVTLEGSFAEVDAVAWAPDGRTLFSGGKDEILRCWDVEGARICAATATKNGEIHGLAVSPDGRRVVVAADAWSKVPAVSQYLNWLSRIVRFDFDRSFNDDVKVIDKITEALPVTLGLNAVALAIIYLVSIPMGVAAAVRRGTFFDTSTSFVLFLLYSLPSFWLATLLIMGFSSKRNFDWFDCVGLHSANQADLSFFAWLTDFGGHLALPMIALVYGSFASLSRYVRTTMLDTISQDYVRTARAKGLSERVVIYRHALRNAMVTIVTLVASLLPAMIGGSVIIESIFSINGMGLLSFEAILTRDYPVIMATTTMSAFLTLLGVLVSDILYVVVDPRITHS